MLFSFSSTGASNFINFWYNQPETSIWQPSNDANIAEGHAVLCVGYDISDPNNPYWIMLNSWGTTFGRPNGLFRVSMNMDYNSTNFQWETLQNIYPVAPFPTTTTTTTPSNVNVKIQSVTLPSSVIANSGISYPTTFRLVNNGSTSVAVTWQAHSSVTGNYDSDSVTVPANGYVDVTKNYLYTTAGPVSLSYTISYNGNQLDSWSGTLNVEAVPNVRIQSVTLPSGAKTSSGIIVTTYPTTFRLVNSESVDVTVTWQVNFSANGNPYSNYTDSVTVPKNDYVDVTKYYYYTVAGTWNVTYTIFFNSSQLDIWSGTMSVIGSNTTTTTPTTIPTTTLTVPNTSQIINYGMPKNFMSTFSVWWTNYLNAGNEIKGTVSLSGSTPVIDWSNTWTFEIDDPLGNVVFSQSYTFSSGSIKTFDFTTNETGTWKIKVSDASNYSRTLQITILPDGWH